MKFDWWTLALQTINVLILLWVLQRFLFKPVQAVVAQRQKAVRKLTEDAAAERDQAAQLRAALEAERAVLTTDREQNMAAARKEARDAGEILLRQTEAEIAQRNAAAQVALKNERTEAEILLRNRASELAGDIARRLLMRLPVATLNAHFIKSTCDNLAMLDPNERSTLLQADWRDPIQVVSADTLDTETQQAAQKSLSAALGREVATTCSCDAGLLAGIELRFRHVIVRNNWAADLQQIMENLTRDEDDAARIS